MYMYAHVDPGTMRMRMRVKLLAVYICLWRQQLSCIQYRLYLRMASQKFDVFYCMATRPRSLLVPAADSYAPFVFNLKDSLGTDAILDLKEISGPFVLGWRRRPCGKCVVKTHR